MAELRDNLSSLWPALAFLLAGVPLAALLERLGFFDAVAAALARGGERDTPVAALWLLAALTTVVLNLDTTIVLLTPLYLQLARRSRVDPLPIVAIPLLLASLASSVLPISNLTTLIVVARLDVGVGEVVGHLGLPSVAAATAGWLVYRRRHPTSLVLPAGSAVDVRARREGPGRSGDGVGTRATPRSPPPRSAARGGRSLRRRRRRGGRPRSGW